MNLEERILNIAEAPAWFDSRELRAIALDVRKMEERIKRLEEAGDAMADVLTWSAAIQYKRSPTVAAWRKAKEAKP